MQAELIYDTAIDTLLNHEELEIKQYWNKSFNLTEGEIIDSLLILDNEFLSKKNDIPEKATALLKSSILHMQLGNLNVSIAKINEAIKYNSNCNIMNLFKSFILLKQGHFNEGFKLFEFRYDVNSCQSILMRKMSKTKLWTGQNLSNKTLLILPEHGYGESIQFVRFISEIKRLNAKSTIIFATQPRLLSFFKSFSIKGLDKLVVYNNEFDIISSNYDFYIPILGIPKVLEISSIKDIDKCIFPYLSAVKSNNKKYTKKNKLKIGITWSGYSNRNSNISRSLDPESLRKLITSLELNSNIEIYNLQYENDSILNSFQNNVKKVLFPDSDFKNTANAINNLDVVISVCTSVLHLSGALNKTTFGLLSFTSNWRWFENKNSLFNEDTPWYPRVKLIRQEKINIWKPVINKLLIEINNILN